MSITRAQVESVLISRCGKRMEFVEFSVVASGNNANLNDPICNALQLIGVNPADITLVTDSDLAAVIDINKLCDLAELRLLENILGNSDKVTLQAASGTEHFSHATDALEKIISRKQVDIQKKYGIGSMTVSGKRNLNFQAKT